MITKRHLIFRAALCIASIAAAASSTGLAAEHDAASAYPAKPLRLIIAFAPGGPADATVRPVAQGLTEMWGQQIIVDHRPGAGGNIAAEITAKAPADGYTFTLVTPGILAVNPTLYGKVPFDTLRDFAGVTNGVTTANVLIVPLSLPVESVKDLIAYARARPGQLSYATAGNGSA